MTIKIINPSNWVPNIKGQYGLGLDGDVYGVLNGNQTWSLTTPDANTMRFEVRKGDVYSWDAQNADAANRSEIADTTLIANGTPVNISYQFDLEPGAPNTANWMVLGQLHQDTDTNNAPWSPPFAIGLAGEKMTIDIRYTGADGLPVTVNLFADAFDIQRGHYYDISITAVVDPNGNGRLVVSRDGVTLTDYSGPLGYTSENGVNWKEGVYRANNATETIAADFRNLAITTGSAVTIPDPSAFIAAPVVGVSTVANPAADGSRLVNVTGTAKLGTTVTLYEKGVAIGTATVDANGHFVSQITVQGTGEHLINAVATDATGRNGVTAQAMAIEIGTSAAIVARLDAIAAHSNVGAIVLTDTSVLTVTSATQMAGIKLHDGAALAKIQGGYSFLLVQSVTGQAYNIQTVAYNAAGVITERMRYAGSTLIYDAKTADNGSSVVKVVNTLGGFDVTNLAADGFTTNFSRTGANNVLSFTQTFNRDGSKATYYYTAGHETSYTLTAADKSTLNVTMGIVGQPYATQAFSFSPTGTLILQERFAANGTKITSQSWGANGAHAVYNYSATTGQETSFTVYNADGSYSSGRYGITGQSYTEQTTFYSKTGQVTGQTTSNDSGPIPPAFVAATDTSRNTYTTTNFDGTQTAAVYALGTLVETDQLNSAGQTISATVYAGNGSTTLTRYDAVSGLATGITQTNPDGSTSVTVYAAGHPGQIASVSLTTASGTLLETDTYNASGQKLSADVFTAGAGDLLTTFDPASGVVTGTTQTNTNGSRVATLFAAGHPGQLASVKTYDASGALIEADLYNAAGQKLSADVFTPGAGDLLTTFDPASGLATGTIQTNADGSTIATLYAAGHPGQVASVNTYDASGLLLETDTYGPNGQEVSSNVYHPDGSDPITTYDPVTGLATSYTEISVDGSKSVAVFAAGHPGQLASVNNYNAAGTLIETDLYDGAGQIASSNVFNADGSALLTTYAPGGGLATGYTQTNADGSKTVATYSVGSSTRLASLSAFNVAGALVAAQTWASDGSTKVYSFRSAGIENGYTVTRADGSKTVATFVPGNEALLLQTTVYNATGFQTEVDSYNAAGIKITANTRSADGSHGVYTYDPTSGALTQYTIYGADRSRTDGNLAITGRPYTQQSATYNAASVLTSMTRWYGDANHTVAFSQNVAADGSQVIINYDTAGRQTTRQVMAVDGSKDVFAMSYNGTATSPATVQQDHYSAANQKLWTDITNADGTHAKTAFATGVSLTASTGVTDTLTSASAGGDTFVFKPAFGQDIITNFHAGAGANHDTIDLTGFNIQLSPGQTSATYLAHALTQVGRDAVLTIAPSETITLKNVLVASVTRDDIRI